RAALHTPGRLPRPGLLQRRLRHQPGRQTLEGAPALRQRGGHLYPRAGVAHEPGTAAAPGWRVGVPPANLQSQGTDALDSLLDAARQGACSAPTPGPGEATDASGIGSLWMTPLASQEPAPRRRDIP